MKKLKELFNAWRHGEDITAEINLELPHIVLIEAIIIVIIIALVKCL